ncbi:16S rRNA pseudouridine(516) synthase [Suicoccus acidiformans]|uniref:Pseudouridine synthase n=1 Tax=Suicoccus acidiformans TaxID=2036206 RepID=A0A347WJM8_9LACT|nr:16S rRNA pseudouridine(516) synthase [Suicoccus acidiformans]
MMRLDKLLAHAGYGSRKDVKKLITSGHIAINGETCTKVGQNVDPDTDQVTYLGEPVNYQEYYYIMLNKPDGIVSATEDREYETVIDWVELDYAHVDLFPVGRLDIDTIGLLLLTNDGQLAHRLTSPRHAVPKRYAAIVEGEITAEAIDQFAAGLDLGDFTSQPAELIVLSYDAESDTSRIEVVITEGKYHQVKRMFEAVDSQVLALQRLAMGPLELDPDLELGEYRELTPAEVAALQAL